MEQRRLESGKTKVCVTWHLQQVKKRRCSVTERQWLLYSSSMLLAAKAGTQLRTHQQALARFRSLSIFLMVFAATASFFTSQHKLHQIYDTLALLRKMGHRNLWMCLTGEPFDAAIP